MEKNIHGLIHSVINSYDSFSVWQFGGKGKEISSTDG